MRVLVTGVGGFVGRHLVEHLRAAEPEAELLGMVWPEDPAPPVDGVAALSGDLRDGESVREVVAAARPDVVYHLAATSSGADAWRNPAPAFEVNAGGTLHLLEAVSSMAHPPVTVVASSGEVYGRMPDGRDRFTEEDPMQPLSPYAGTKACQDLLALQYHASHGLPTVRLRLFHHTGPGRPDHFVASSFARQIAEIEKGLRTPRLAVGNLDAIRDFSDVRDIARAWRLASIHGRPGGVYNVCSGRGISIRDVLNLLLGLCESEISVDVDPARLRPSDLPLLVGDPGRFESATGWRPEIELTQTMSDLLDWWRLGV